MIQIEFRLLAGCGNFCFTVEDARAECSNQSKITLKVCYFYYKYPYRRMYHVLFTTYYSCNAFQRNIVNQYLVSNFNAPGFNLLPLSI